MGIANVIQTATSATHHHHHHHTELPKSSSKTELLIGIMKSQRKKKKKHHLCGYLQEFCGSARIPTIVTLLGGIVVAPLPPVLHSISCVLYPTTTTTTTNFFNIIKLE
jgi:hypothetical protein